VRYSSFALGLLFSLCVAWPAHLAQAEAHAEISRPASGDRVAGVVTILGSASSADFDHYELFFGYDPNPTDTWFPIGDPVTTQVSFGRLGLWDTTEITDGTYTLRVTVTLADGSVVEDVVKGIEVGGSTSVRSSAPPGTAAPSSGQVIEGPLPSPAAASIAPSAPIEAAEQTPRHRGIDVPAVVLAGASAAVVALAGLAAYVEARRTVRGRWGAIRSRRLQTGPRTGDREESERS
jgi:hypothetical protein